jgi:arylsulfatase A-like enzyme
MKYVACLLSLTFFSAVVPCETVLARSADKPRPNILLIVTDDQGWNDIGYHNDHVRTPNMDRLCRMGVELDAHYVQPQCSPTRTALMTGRYPSRFGPGPTVATNDPCYPKGTVTLASMLEGIGYDTALVGKWHMGSTPDYGPNHFGFQYSYGSLAGAVGMYDHRYRLNTKYADTWHRNGVLIGANEDGHVTDLVAADAVRFLEKPRDKPFFLYLPFHAVHTPLAEKDPKWEAMNKHVADPDRRLFLAAASHLDDAIGRIIDAVQKSVGLENTLVIFTSDNGGIHTGYRGNTYPAPDPNLKAGFSSNSPLRGGKTDAYEGGVRVPAFVVWPGRLDPRRMTARMHVVDWLPTLATLVGYDERRLMDTGWDGHDVWPLLSGEQDDYDHPRTIYTNWGNRRWVSIHHGDMKIVRNGDKPWQLFDLAVDPNETTDLAKERPEQIETLERLYRRFRDDDQE